MKLAKKRSNCLAYAIRKYLKDGGYIIFGPSKHGWWTHVCWAKSIEGIPVEQYIPVNPVDLKDLPKIIQKVPLHIMLYKGKVVDENEEEIHGSES